MANDDDDTIDDLNWPEDEPERDWGPGDPLYRVPPAFEPERRDDNDLEWFFGLGRHPKYLTPKQQRRWAAVSRRLDGHGYCLQRYYTNEAKLNDRRLAVCTRDDIVTWMALTLRSSVSDDFDASKWVARADAMAARGSGLGDDARRILNSLQEAAVGKLQFDYQIYLENKTRDLQRGRGKNVRYEPPIALTREELAAVLARRNTHHPMGGSLRRTVAGQVLSPRYEHPVDMADDVIRELGLEMGTWGALRIPLVDARFIAAKAGIDPARPLSQGDLTRLFRSLSGDEVARREASAKPEPADVAIKETKRTQREMKRARPEAYAALMEWAGTLGQALPPERWAESEIERDNGRLTTTASELAERLKPLGHSRVKQLLVKYGCPGADRPYGKLDVEWFGTEAGRAFKGEAADCIRLALGISTRRPR